MKKVFSLILASSLILPALPASLHAEVSSAGTTSASSAVISPLNKGQSAPFTGVLFSPAAVASIVVEINSAKEKTKIEVEAAVKAAEAKKDFRINEIVSQCTTDKNVLGTRIEEKNQQIKVLNDEVERMKKETPNRSVWAGVGFVGGFVFTLLTVFAVNKINN